MEISSSQIPKSFYCGVMGWRALNLYVRIEQWPEYRPAISRPRTNESSAIQKLVATVNAVRTAASLSLHFTTLSDTFTMIPTHTRQSVAIQHNGPKIHANPMATQTTMPEYIPVQTARSFPRKPG